MAWPDSVSFLVEDAVMDASVKSLELFVYMYVFIHFNVLLEMTFSVKADC